MLPTLIWLISALSIALVIVRPFRVPEFVWAVGGALLLLLLQLLTPAEALAGVAKGLDVYLLPAGLVAGSVMQAAPVPETVRSAVLIGIDLGPNLSVTGSLATLLWLVALRRENIQVSAWQFLRLGAVVMTVPLLLAIASLFV